MKTSIKLKQILFIPIFMLLGFTSFNAPNPATSDFIIYIEEPNSKDNPGDITVRIVDIMGKEVFVNTYEDFNNKRISIDFFKEGVYFVNIVKGNWTKSMKLVKH